MKVLISTFEMYPFIKVGGLADVTYSVAKGISKKHNVCVVMPLHSKIETLKFKIAPLLDRYKRIKKVLIPLGAELAVGEIYHSDYLSNMKLFFIKNDEFFNRNPIYATNEGEYVDNAKRYIFFSRACLELCKAVEFKPDLIHCQDMQTGLIPAYLKTIYKTDAYFQNVPVVFTIHNIGYQGIYAKENLEISGIPWSEFTFEKLEYYDQLNFMKAGIVYADSITTVSPTYAKEIQSDDVVGAGLSPVLACRASDIHGIVNGLDYEEWNPMKDEYIPSKFSYKNLSGKAECKKKLLQMCSWKDTGAPLFGMVSRIVEMKGFQLLMDAFDEIMKLNLKLVILGMGERVYEEFLLAKSKEYPEKLKVFIEFNNPLAHQIYAGCDFFLMPSRNEPCGLTQMISMAYGTIPVVHATGGLIDTVEDSKTGIVFYNFTTEGLISALKRALETYSNKKLMIGFIRRVMKKKFYWNNSIKEYLTVYENTIKKTL